MLSSQYQPMSAYNPQTSNYQRESSLLRGFELEKRESSNHRATHNDNSTWQRYEEIRRKYASKEKNGTSSYESSALKEISLRHSNYNNLSATKNQRKYDNSIEKKYESRTNSYATQSPQPFLPCQRDLITTSPFLREEEKQSLSNNQLRSVSIDEHHRVSVNSFIPSVSPSTSHRPRNTRLDTSTISRSIEKYVPERANERERERVGSIDKINLKIYQILNCLNENTEKREELKYEPEKHKEGNSVRFNLNDEKPSLRLQAQKQIPKPQIETPIQKPVTSNYSYEPITIDKSVEQVSDNRASRKLGIPSLDRPPRRYSMLTSSFHDPSKLKKSTARNQDSRRSSSILKDRDIDQQIRRIQERIKLTEQKKKKLNITCQEWRETQKENEGSVPKRVESIQKEVSRYSVLNRYNRPNDNSVFKVSEQKPKEQKEEVPRFALKSSELRQRSVPINVMCHDTQTQKQVVQQQNTASRIVQNNNRGGLRNLAINSIKSSILYSDESLPESLAKPETKRLIESLKNQVSYDECLRNAKVLLSYNQSHNKNELINQILSKNGIVFGQEEFKRQIETTLEEHNPFFSVKQSNQPIEQLVSKYIDSYRHWNEKIKGKFSRDSFKIEGFSEQKIDMQKKGALSLEDLVRFLNIETGNFYRNRDIVLLFRRITSNGVIQFGELLNVLCQK